MMAKRRIALSLAILALGGGAGLACGDASDRNSNDDTERPQYTSDKASPTGGTATEEAVPPPVTETSGTLPDLPDTTGQTAP